MKYIFIFCFLIFFISCASSPQKSSSQTTSNEKDTYSFEEAWQAIYHLTIEFPIHDLSKEEGTVESEWIYENDLNRYRFFVFLNSDELEFQKNPFVIDIESQSRKNQVSSWKQIAPSLDKEEKIKKHLYDHLKKNRSA